MAQCQKCNADVGCGCNLITMPDGKKVCKTCQYTYKTSQSHVQHQTANAQLGNSKGPTNIQVTYQPGG
jgi:uncharacterized Zn finger protein (UPF0148 family)